MKELELKYGCNPNQKPASISVENGELPIEVINGKPGYINLLDAFNGWQLVQELKQATGLAAAASFKHVSPAGAALGLPLSDVLRQIYFIDPSQTLSPLACAYARARGADRMSSFGDWVALSDVCDETTAMLLQHEVSDGIIAPGFEQKALDILKNKRKGGYNIVKIDASYVPPLTEKKDVFGITFTQGRNTARIDTSLLYNIVTKADSLTAEQERDLLVSLITLKYTQSNSVCYAKDGQAIGVGAGQQSRIHCTRLAGNKADYWHLRQHPKVLSLPFLPEISRPDRDNAIDIFISEDAFDLLDGNMWSHIFTHRPSLLSREEKKEYLSAVSGVALGSDAFFPFGDNIERAQKSGVTCIAQPGGSIRDYHVIDTCNKYGIAMAFTNLRLFFH